jgi:hypothetical protein
MPMQAFIGNGCPKCFLVPVSSVYKQDLVELYLAAQCSSLVLVKRPHEECGFRLTCGSKRFCCRRQKDTITLMVCTQLWTQLYLRVGTQLLLLWMNLQASSCRYP